MHPGFGSGREVIMVLIPSIYGLWFYCDLKTSMVTNFITVLVGNLLFYSLWSTQGINVSLIMTLIVLLNLVTIIVECLISYITGLH